MRIMRVKHRSHKVISHHTIQYIKMLERKVKLHKFIEAHFDELAYICHNHKMLLYSTILKFD